MSTQTHYKRPESVLVVVYTATKKFLLLRRADHADFWQSVTGSLLWEESAPRAAAARELQEETGLAIDPASLEDLGLIYRFAILPRWRARYAAGTTENTEHAFALELPAETALTIQPSEHSEYVWLPVREALARASSWTNREAIEKLARRWS